MNGDEISSIRFCFLSHDENPGNFMGPLLGYTNLLLTDTSERKAPVRIEDYRDRASSTLKYFIKTTHFNL